MLAEKSMVWDRRQTLKALIHEIAATVFEHMYVAAWERFYRELKYQTGIGGKYEIVSGCYKNIRGKKAEL